MWIRIRNHHQDEQFEHNEGPAELGRALSNRSVRHMHIRDPKISRRQMRVIHVTAEQAQLTNLSRHVVLILADGSKLLPAESRDLALPLRLYAGDTCVDIQTAKSVGGASTVEDDTDYRTRSQTLSAIKGTPDVDTLIAWFGTLIGVLRTGIDTDGLYHESARALFELFGMDYGLVLQRQGLAWRVEAYHPAYTDEYSHTIIQQMAETKQTVCETFLPGVNPSESLRGVEAAVASPIFDEQGEIVAALYAARRGNSPDAAQRELILPIEMQLIQLLATAVGSGIARLEHRAQVERLHTEMELARRIQTGFFPRQLPDVPGYELAGHTQPAAVTGGDYYDVLPVEGDQIGLVIADVCGHGFGPSLLMASMRAALRGLAVREADPARLLSDLNNTMHEELTRRMITVLYGLLDPQRHVFRYANAGHGPAVLHVSGGDGACRLLHEDENRNLPMGVVTDLLYQNCQEVAMRPGDLIVLGSDGLVERTDAFGMDQFRDLIVRLRHEPVEEIIEQAIEACLSSKAMRVRDDDLTLLVARRT